MLSPAFGGCLLVGVGTDFGPSQRQLDVEVEVVPHFCILSPSVSRIYNDVRRV